MRLSQPLQIPLKALLPLPFLNLPLHDTHVRAQLEAFSISKPEIVVWIAFEKLHTFGFEGGIEVVKGFAEELGEEEKGGALVESVFAVAEERATAPCEAVFLEDRDGVAGFCEAGCG